VSEVTFVTKTISSFAVSGSRAIVNWSTLPAVSVTPPISDDAVPVATVVVVPLLDNPVARVVSTLVLEYLRVIYFP
jgi:hypothetical protein